jgi:hypothetical protein
VKYAVPVRCQYPLAFDSGGGSQLVKRNNIGIGTQKHRPIFKSLLNKNVVGKVFVSLFCLM